MNSALINASTYIVENTIVADPSIDPAPEGYILVEIPEGSGVTFNWVYDPQSKTFTEGQ